MAVDRPVRATMGGREFMVAFRGTGTAAPLRRFELLRAGGIELAEASAADWLTACRLRPRIASRGTDPRYTVSATKVWPVRLVYAHAVGAEMDVDFLQQESSYDINFAIEGVNRIETRDDQAVVSARQAAILSPRMVVAMQQSDGYGQLHVRIERFALERQLERMLGRPVTGPIRFRMAMDLSNPALASWARGIKLLVDDLDQPGGLSAAAAGASPWSDFLMTGLLLAQPHNYSASLAQGQAEGRRPPSLKRAVDLIDRDPAGDLSLARLAAVTGVGTRALQRNFREYVGVSPREYVVWVRLERAHHDLAAGAADTVAEIALRWGFTHVPRFAGAYQQRYGRPPSETLRSARSDGAARPT